RGSGARGIQRHEHQPADQHQRVGRVQLHGRGLAHHRGDDHADEAQHAAEHTMKNATTSSFATASSQAKRIVPVANMWKWSVKKIAGPILARSYRQRIGKITIFSAADVHVGTKYNASRRPLKVLIR